MGLDFRILDGNGLESARSSALTQAIALKPAGIAPILDAAPIIEQAVAAGVKVVGWHSGPAPGKINGVPGVITNITTDPLRSPRRPVSTPSSILGKANADAVHPLHLRDRHRQDQRRRRR